MGRIAYRPKKSHKNHREKEVGMNEVVTDMRGNELLDNPEQHYEEEVISKSSEEVNREETLFIEPQPIKIESTVQEIRDADIPNHTFEVKGHKNNQRKMENFKVIGDMECDYHIYLEDYVYTYIYQFAYSDLAKESSAILIGEVYLDSKEAIIRGIIPVDGDKLSADSQWISPEVIEEIEVKRKAYFGDQDIIGWMHMQPGYGTMLTMKELREHKNVFEGTGSLFMLVDAINKIETLYVFDEEELREQSGYCMYYERNEQMQRFMLDHPFAKKESEEIKDTVVNQFREIGKLRKEEYLHKKSISLSAMTAAVVLIALSAFIYKMNSDKLMPDSQTVMAQNNGQTSISQGDDKGIDLIIKENQLDEGTTSVQEEEKLVLEEEASVIQDEVVGENAAIKEDVGENTTSVVEENIEALKEESAQNKEEVKEEVTESKEVEIKADSEEIEYEVYVVQIGDTLANICYNKYGDAKKSLEVAKFNGLDNTNQIYVGQKLKMPEK